LKHDLPTFWMFRNKDGETAGPLPSNVDDLVYGYLADSEEAMRTHLPSSQ